MDRDWNVAAHWYQKAANQNLAVAQCNLANLYAAGSGVKKDLTMAATWYLVAQHNGDDEAAADLKPVAATLTPEQTADAKAAAKQWLQKAR